MKLPYAIKLIPEKKGWYFSEIEEFPGCMADGETIEKALLNLEISKKMWLESMLDKNYTIPEPEITKEYSGRILVRIPPSLHKRIANAAKMENLSLNQMILFLLTDKTAIYEIKEEMMKAIQESEIKATVKFITELIYKKTIKIESTKNFFQQQPFFKMDNALNDSRLQPCQSA